MERMENVTNSGTISDMQLFVDAGGESVAQDQAGNVYLAAGQVEVFSPDGKLIGRIDLPERPIDLVFGGSDSPHALHPHPRIVVCGEDKIRRSVIM
jgi:sugar lactone lactonase YvrE